MGELKPGKIGIALGLVFAIVSLICAILVYVFPNAMLSLANNIFHGIDITQIAQTSLSWGSVVVGIVEVFVIGFVGGWLFGVVYNWVNR